MPHHDPFTLDHLDVLLERRAGPCVSIFMPTTRISRETDRDRIVLKNLRAEAFKRLMDQHGLRLPDAEALVLPVDELLEDDGFWPYLSDGLALFLAPDAHFTFRLAQPFTELLALGERFVVKPLVPLLSGDGTFYVLAISQNQARLIEGGRQGANEIRVEEMPGDMAKALSMRGREGTRAPNKQWQGDEGQKTLYRKYFLQIDRALRPFLGAEPLVIAGVSYLVPIFREATSYRHLVPEGIPGNPEELSAAELHAKAWPLVEPFLDAPRRQALERFESLRGTDRVTDEVSTILGGALDGRVQTLFLALESDLFGDFDPETRQTVVHGAEAKAGDIDLGSLAGRWVYARGGNVFGVTAAEIPDGRPVAAIMRY